MSTSTSQGDWLARVFLGLSEGSCGIFFKYFMDICNGVRVDLEAKYEVSVVILNSELNVFEDIPFPVRSSI